MKSDNNHYRREAERLIRENAAIDKIASLRPRWMLTPHDNGQIQMLRSRHDIRIAIPGNGWGKTTAMAMAADMIIQKDDPFNPDLLRDWPAVGIWVCQKFQQLDLLRHQLEEEVWTRPWRWNETKHKYMWPNGGEMHIVSADSDWRHIQGIAADFICFDEHPDRKLWTELQFRRRGKRKTRFMVAATMTQGMTWFVREVIQPWEEYHRAKGLAGPDAREQQLHPKIWVWDAGGISSNPSMSQEDIEHYESITNASTKELEVRLQGGYADFTGDPVFDRDSLDEQLQYIQEGEDGMLEVRDVGDDSPIAKDASEDEKQLHKIEQSRRGGRNQRHKIIFRPDLFTDGGRVTVFEPPCPKCTYVMGADFAAGLAGRDYDTCVVLKKGDDGVCEQVAEAQGWWGDGHFAEILYSLGVWYFNAFIVGERQFGLPTLRRLWDEYLYRNIYRGRMETSQTRRPSDLLGHHRSAADTTIPNLRQGLRNRSIILRSEDLVTELRQYQYMPKHKADDPDMLKSNQLITSAPSGMNDDLVLACAYAWHAAREVGRFVAPEPPPSPGTFGWVFQNDRILRGKKPHKRKTFLTA